MGISVSFRGSQVHPAERTATLQFAREHAASAEWGMEPLVQEAERGWLDAQAIDAPRLEGMVLIPHFAMDPLPVVFLEGSGALVDAYVQDRGDSAIGISAEPLVETLFAGISAHREVCSFLEILKRRFVPDLRIDDETGYFQDRNEERLQRAFERAWSRLQQEVRASSGEPGTMLVVGGCPLRVSPHQPTPVAEFGRVARHHVELVLELDRVFVAQYGDLEFTLDHSAESVEDLDLIVSHLDDQGWASRTDDQDVETLAHQIGAYFGRTVADILGGTWEIDDDQGLFLADVGGIGLQLNPFQMVADRIVGGPSFGFGLHLGLYRELSTHLS